MTTIEALAEEDESEVSTMTMEASTGDAEEATRPSECLRRQRRRCDYGTRSLTTTTVDSTEEDGTKDSATMTEASAGDKE